MKLLQFLNETTTENRPIIPGIPKELNGLVAEAQKAGSFENFRKDFLTQIKHGTYWHLTDNPNFTIDSSKGPRDMSSMVTGSMTPGKLMITSDLDHWHDYYNEDEITRPYAALIDMSLVPRNAYYQVARNFGNEFFVSDPSDAKVIKVIPIENALQYNNKAHSLLPNSEKKLEQFYDIVMQALN